MTWFVEFFSEKVNVCITTKPIWNEFSMKYTNKYLRFAEVNIDKLPSLL
jgi:hypothetical protein